MKNESQTLERKIERLLKKEGVRDVWIDNHRHVQIPHPSDKSRWRVATAICNFKPSGPHTEPIRVIDAAHVAKLESLVAAIPGIITTLTDINNAAGTVNFSSHTQMKEGINAAVELSESELARLSKVVEEIES